MEGLIPYVYKAIVEYRKCEQGRKAGSRFKESPSASSSRLLGDSKQYQSSQMQFFEPDHALSLSSPSSTSQLISSGTTTTPQSLQHRYAHQRLV
ncbi:hypothetical protein AAC387_Pa07g3830 [Persea americana]